MSVTLAFLRLLQELEEVPAQPGRDLGPPITHPQSLCPGPTMGMSICPPSEYGELLRWLVLFFSQAHENPLLRIYYVSVTLLIPGHMFLLESL